MRLNLVFSIAISMLGCVTAPSPSKAAASDLPTVEYVDLQRYIGHWYEIAALPQWFEEGCFGVQADYALRDDGKVSVVNTCYEGALDGPVKTANGVARVVDVQTNAKLAVSFFWPFEGDYWILDLADDYSYVLVGAPDRESLWILSRTPQLDETIIEALLTKAAALGFDVTQVRRMVQAE